MVVFGPARRPRSPYIPHLFTRSIFFGRAGEFATNRWEDAEVAMLCHRLLSISLVSSNTLMLQRVLTEPK